MWRGNAGHTAAVAGTLPAQLHLEWTRKYRPRRPAWDDALNRDMMTYDQVFEPVIANGKLFVNFNDTDKIVAFDLHNGKELWRFYSDGPVRFSPVAYQESVLFCSDDGYLYCLKATDGQLQWRVRGGPTDRKVLGNHRVISTWPARGGPVVANDTVYFAASIWPFMGTFTYAVDARTGAVRWCNDGTGAEYQKQPHSAPAFAGVAPQGQLTVAGDLLLVPGGRTLPAAFDRATGKLKFFSFGGKGQGGSFVAADPTRAFVHTRIRGTVPLALPTGKVQRLSVNEPVLDGDMLYTAAYRTQFNSYQGEPRIEAYDRSHQRVWEVPVDGSGDLIKVGTRLYAAGPETITAIDLPSDQGGAQVAWTLPAPGNVRRLLAGNDHLVAVTLEGEICVYGVGDVTPTRDRTVPRPIAPVESGQQWARQILKATQQGEGHALWFGVDDLSRVAAVVAQSDLRLIAVDADPQRIADYRRQLNRAGLYGKRVNVHLGIPTSYLAPAYLANLVIVEQSAAAILADPEQLRQVFASVRPYGGRLWIECPTAEQAALGESISTLKLPEGAVTKNATNLIIARNGPLPGASNWTHQYGNVANTVKSDDRVVKAPLGLLWFGNNSNADVLPRHGHGPSEQVVDGRLFIEGTNSLNARDVYTGRTLWRRNFKDLGTFGQYYDETYKDTPLSTAYNELHIPGANARGTNFVATHDGVYLVVLDRCLLLDSTSGRTVREFALPKRSDGSAPRWTYVGVYEDLLLAGVDFADYSKAYGYQFKTVGKKGAAWKPDYSACQQLLAFDRQSGKIVWQLQSRYSFLHNAIVAGGGHVCILDRLPKRVEEAVQRRGNSLPTDYRLLALDAKTGNVAWQHGDNVFGTWLSYSEAHDLVVQAGSAATDRGLDEVDHGLAVYRASDGTLVWENRDLKYAGPCILHGDAIITNTTSYHENQGAYNLLTGARLSISDPVTDTPFAWRFTRNYGCNTAVASEYLLTFRSGAAGFYDLENHAGTGSIGGFKSGCSTNLIVANGVLNAPDYTRTCSCGYQNQASLALVPMPNNEMWTFDLLGRDATPGTPVQRIGVNLGAPGDRVDSQRVVWVNHPADAGASPEVPVRVAGQIEWFRRHSSRITADTLPWVAASGAVGITELTIPLAVGKKTPQTAAERHFTVTAVFVEPDQQVGSGQRVFDVAIGGQPMLTDFDVVDQAGAPLIAVVKKWQHVVAKSALEITITSKSTLPGVLCGVSVVAEE